MWTASGIVAGVAGLIGVKAAQIGAMIHAGKSFQMPPESVTSAPVEKSDWQPSLSGVGSLVAVHAVTLGAELSGTVREIDFESGASIKQGAVLVRLDTSTEEAQLAAAQADATLAKVQLDRAQALRRQEATTAADFDMAQARAKQTAATVAALTATIAKKTIRAPFDGRIAIRQVELGQVVSSGTPIASLQSVDPIYVDFWLPQHALADVKEGQTVLVHTDIYPDKTWEGKVAVINPEIDIATRNVRVRASLPNADGHLRPGAFANVEVSLGDKQPVLTIPVTSVVYAPYGDSVFVLQKSTDPTSAAKTLVEQRFVRLGEHRGDLVVVQSGLTAGDTIVSSGAFKLRNRAAVVVKNDLAPTAELMAAPIDK